MCCAKCDATQFVVTCLAPKHGKAAYTDEDMPACRTATTIPVLLAKIPMRSTHKSVKGPTPAIDASALLQQLIGQLTGQSRPAMQMLQGQVGVDDGPRPPASPCGISRTQVVQRHQPEPQASTLPMTLEFLSPKPAATLPMALEAPPALTQQAPPALALEGPPEPTAGAVPEAEAVPALTADAAAANGMDDEDPDDIVAKMEALAQGKQLSKPKAKAKSKAKSKAKAAGPGQPKKGPGRPRKAECEAKPAAKGKAKPAAKGKAKAAAKRKAKTADKKNPNGLLLGCGKCRRNSKGCTQCRNPDYRGARGPL